MNGVLFGAENIGVIVAHRPETIASADRVIALGDLRTELSGVSHDVRRLRSRY